MQEIIVGFLGVAIVAMVIMAYATKSIGGAFIGLAVVMFGSAMLSFRQGGMSILLGVILIFASVLVLFAAFGLGLNFTHSQLSGYDNQGKPFTATQTVIGEGAKNTRSSWNSPTMQKSLPDSNQKLLDD